MCGARQLARAWSGCPRGAATRRTTTLALRTAPEWQRSRNESRISYLGGCFGDRTGVRSRARSPAGWTLGGPAPFLSRRPEGVVLAPTAVRSIDALLTDDP